MFDDLNKENKESISQTQALKQNEQVVVEDIFSDSKEPVEQKEEKQSDHDLGINSLEIEQQNKRKLIVLFLMFIGLVAIGWGTYFVFSRIVKNISKDDSKSIELNNNLSEEQKTLEDEIKKVPVVVEAEEDVSEVETDDELFEKEEDDVIDSDKDGLSDEEEVALGLNIENVDTDSDGLFDREEVKIYKTDPLNPDTDSDGFLDGEEVKAGYNPKGSGRILNINRNQN